MPAVESAPDMVPLFGRVLVLLTLLPALPKPVTLTVASCWTVTLRPSLAAVKPPVPGGVQVTVGPFRKQSARAGAGRRVNMAYIGSAMTPAPAAQLRSAERAYMTENATLRTLPHAALLEGGTYTLAILQRKPVIATGCATYAKF